MGYDKREKWVKTYLIIPLGVSCGRQKMPVSKPSECQQQREGISSLRKGDRQREPVD